MPPRKPATDPAAPGAKPKATRMLVPLSERAEKLVRDVARLTSKTQASILVEVSTRTRNGRPMLDGLVEEVCQGIAKEHAAAMNALFVQAPETADNGGALDPSGGKEA